MYMKSWWTIGLVSLTIVNASMPLMAQTGGSIGAPSNRPAAGSDRRPSPPIRSGARPARPSMPSADQPFRRPTILGAPPFAGPRRSFAVRSLWFGLIAFDRSWLWTPGAVDDTAAPPPEWLQQRPVGGLQLDVDPRRAVVYVDGWYAGLVDEFSGYYHHLEVAAGWHTFEIVAADYDPLVVDLSISPGRTTTYRGSLQRATSRD